MLIVYWPITLDELTCSIRIPDDLSNNNETLLEIIAICGSILTLREDNIVFVYQYTGFSPA